MLSGSGSARKGLGRLRGRPSDQNDKDQQFTDHQHPSYGQTDQTQTSIARLCPGKRLVMEKFFTPVNNAQDEIRIRKHHHRRQHHHNYEQEDEAHSYSMLEDNNQNTDESHGSPHHYHQHDYPLHDNSQHDHHYPHHHNHHPFQDKEIYDPHHTTVTLSRASSSSLSSSSSSFSSFTSRYAETSATDPYAVRPTELPPHSFSCSNILEVHGGFQEDNGSESIVLETIKHGRPEGNYRGGQERSKQRESPRFSSLNRGHSRSVEGLLQRNDDLDGRQHKAPHPDHGPLYKTASLNRSLAFSEENILLGVSRGPKRAVSSSQLPGKGILKNKEPRPDIRKAKSMEVLSPRVANKQCNYVGKDREVPQAKIEKARENFVQAKLQFSAFLDEITKQVISPSHLSVLGVNNGKSTGTTSNPAQYSKYSAKPQLPAKKHSSGDEKEQRSKQHVIQEKPARNNPQLIHRKHSDRSNPDKPISHRDRNHHGSPPPHVQTPTNHHPHPVVSRKDRTSLPTEGHEARDGYNRHGPHLIDGTSTSQEPVSSKKRHHHKLRPIASLSPPPSHAQHCPHQQPHRGQSNPVHQSAHSPPLPPAMASGLGPESESPSTKSDSSRSRDTASAATSQGSEQDGRYRSRAAAHAGHLQQRRDMPCDSEQLQALQEENADLHQNLLQTVVCIENLEAELQWTRNELSHAKEKYNCLLETHTGAKEANNLLGEHLHIASESLSSERNYLHNRITQLTSELEDAHRTIAALETINVPCLIQDMLEKHLDSTETLEKFLKTATSASPSIVVPTVDNQSYAAKATEVPHNWLKEPEAGLQRVTAFLPWKQDRVPTGKKDSEQSDSCSSSPLTVASITTAIYNKMVANYATSGGCFHPQPPPCADHTDPKSCLLHNSKGGGGGGGEMAQGGGEVTYLSAQKVLDDFMHQLQAHKEAGGQNEAGWARGRGGEPGRETE